MRHENLVMGRVGNFAFDNQIFQQIEERFRANLHKRKTHVIDGAIKASQHYNIQPHAIFSPPPTKIALLESLTPLKNKDVSYVRKSSVGRRKIENGQNFSVNGSSKAHSVVPSRFTNKVSLKDLLARARSD